MSIFSTILAKLGFAKEATAQSLTGQGTETASAAVQEQALSAAISAVDVVTKLEGMAQTHREKLNWKVSIVDLMKLLGLDSNLTARKELAVELGCPADKMDDSAQMNIWLHKTVLKKLAENGGNIPPELLD